MLDEKYIALIDDYLDGILDEQAKESLEKELKANTDLQELFGMIKLSRESIKLAGQKEMLSKIHAEFLKEEKIAQKESKKFSISPWWIGIAASLTLFIVAGNFWLSTQADDFYTSNYMAYELPTMRSGENTDNEVEVLFKEKAFDAVVSTVNISSEDQSDLFLAGLALMELEDYEISVRYLRRLEEINKNQAKKVFQEETDYYLFLSLVKLEKFEEATEYFDRINENKLHAFHGNLDTMDKLRFKILRRK